MAINRVRVVLTGVAGLPGVATHYFQSTATDMTALRTFWDAIKSNFPNSCTIQVPNSGDQLNEATGIITGAWAGPPQLPVSGSGGVGTYLSTAGPMVTWQTNQVVDGRRPKGKTFLIPAMSGSFDSSGTISSTFQTTLQNAATALIVAYAGDFKIFHRPNAKGVGTACTIVSATINDKQYILRSRRA